MAVFTSSNQDTFNFDRFPCDFKVYFDIKHGSIHLTHPSLAKHQKQSLHAYMHACIQIALIKVVCLTIYFCLPKHVEMSMTHDTALLLHLNDVGGI